MNDKDCFDCKRFNPESFPCPYAPKPGTIDALKLSCWRKKDEVTANAV